MPSHRHTSTDEARQRETAAVVGLLQECTDPDELARLRQRLVVLNVPVATSIALRYRSRGEAVEDLVQAAHLGLVKAVNGFDADRGHDFLAYAVPTISGEVKRHFRDQGWDIRPPRRVQELRGEVEKASSELTQTLGRSPRISEIAAHLGASEDDVVECVASADLYHVHSLDAPVGGAEDLNVGDTLGDVDPLLGQIDDVLSVRPLMDRLPPRDRRILALRYFSGWTQQQIAEDVGVTQMQVSRLITKALRRLREGLEAA
ncbi:SigB/SigF/SigG family RNA polymerase sigma factor [Kineosporia sp. A_224]|uniref:SigB/SigF/SigG family RNA polymerase sigma factor n=1 Tax=Kineosporia sp. A_224 TaxID=1962180 RepID=UPI001303FFA3|nr:SigB/SigF/SigG family RNA polymerase sigma factor [Kineosporia sp. A_224]